jgi:hypothetical protein
VGEVRRIWPFFEVESFVAQFNTNCLPTTPSVCWANHALIVEGLHKAGLK